jgi:hypothetical protein
MERHTCEVGRGKGSSRSQKSGEDCCLEHGQIQLRHVYYSVVDQKSFPFVIRQQALVHTKKISSSDDGKTFGERLRKFP